MKSYGSFHSLKRIHKRKKKREPEEEVELVSFKSPAFFLYFLETKNSDLKTRISTLALEISIFLKEGILDYAQKDMGLRRNHKYRHTCNQKLCLCWIKKAYKENISHFPSKLKERESIHGFKRVDLYIMSKKFL